MPPHFHVILISSMKYQRLFSLLKINLGVTVKLTSSYDLMVDRDGHYSGCKNRQFKWHFTKMLNRSDMLDRHLVAILTSNIFVIISETMDFY